MIGFVDRKKNGVVKVRTFTDFKLIGGKPTEYHQVVVEPTDDELYEEPYERIVLRMDLHDYRIWLEQGHSEDPSWLTILTIFPFMVATALLLWGKAHGVICDAANSCISTHYLTSAVLVVSWFVLTVAPLIIWFAKDYQHRRSVKNILEILLEKKGVQCSASEVSTDTYDADGSYLLLPETEPDNV